MRDDVKYYKEIYGDLLKLEAPGVMSHAAGYRPIDTWNRWFDYEKMFEIGLETGVTYAVPDSLILLRGLPLC